MDKPEIDTDRIDDAVLALMYLTLHGSHPEYPNVRAWKGYDWAALSRLHERDMIFDPVGKTKSVMLTEEGMRRSEELFHTLFAKR